MTDQGILDIPMAELERLIAQLLGCDHLHAEIFDHGGQLGMSGRIGKTFRAVVVHTTGRKEHDNHVWVQSYPLVIDYINCIIALKIELELYAEAAQ